MCCIVAGAVLKIAASVILPFTIAFLLAFVMFPVVRWLDKRRIPRFVSILLVVIIIVSGLSIFGMVLFTSGINILSIWPKYENRLNEIYSWIARSFDLSFDESLSVWQNLWMQLGIRNWVRSFAFSFSNIFLSFISSAVLVVLFVVFILLEASRFGEKLEAAFEDRAEHINKMGYELMYQVTRYLTAKFFISLATGLITAFGLWLIGLEFAVIWGIIAFMLNFIPILGSITAGFSTSLFALIQFWPNPVPIILVVTFILAINMIIGNFLDPKIVGEHVGISPLMVLISLGIWGFIWGFAGAILAVPMTVIIKIICENVPILEPVSILIGTRKAVQAKKSKSEKAET
jgi:predicted PurR-regulated permease PerM